MRIEIKDKNNFMMIFNQIFNNKITAINGLSIDSRKIKENDIYVPIKGRNYDGHDFIEDVLKIKGTICLSENNNLLKNHRIIHTSSNNEILLMLAENWRKKSSSKIIAITGSNGKTTAKDLLHHILSKKFNCGKSSGNHNSTIGLPITYLKCNLNDDFTIGKINWSKLF